ncbi:MAG: hypothetical protein KAT71_05190 [Gammaproteobacteria bacterium]|nr:hypothetical protein [Gammaproteobacteria bacterium]
MVKNIKKIAHDLLPLSNAITELSSIISQLLNAINPHANFDDKNAKKHLEECSEASEKMALSARLIREYVEKLNNEADIAGITKD